MNRQANILRNDIGRLADDAGNIVSETLDAAGNRVGEVGNRLSSAMQRGRDRGREIYSHALDRAIVGTKSADDALRDHLYLTIAIGACIGIGIGVLVSYVTSSRRGDRKQPD